MMLMVLMFPQGEIRSATSAPANTNIRFTEHTLVEGFDGASSVYAIDLDEDGDMDILGTAWNELDLAWWENDGSERFTQHTIAGGFDRLNLGLRHRHGWRR